MLLRVSRRYNDAYEKRNMARLTTMCCYCCISIEASSRIPGITDVVAALTGVNNNIEIRTLVTVAYNCYRQLFNAVAKRRVYALIEESNELNNAAWHSYSW